MAQYDDSEMILEIYPLGESRYILREDDGQSLEYEEKPSCHTEIVCRASADGTEIWIGNRSGEYAGKCPKRLWKVRLHGACGAVSIRVQAEGDSAVLL